MALHCDLRLDESREVYQSGDFISGQIVLSLPERNLIKALALKISGYAQVTWMKTRKMKKHKSKRKEDFASYFNRDDYLATLNYFIGSEDANPKLIDPGNYSYRFSLKLPESCPSSFESEKGYIRYELKVFIDYVDHRDTCVHRILKVQKPLDLRGDPLLLQPVELDIMESIRRSKFWRKPLVLHVDIPQSGFIPGENISVHVKLLNSDRLALHSLIYQLNQVTFYTGQMKKKIRTLTESRTLQSHCHSLFGQNRSLIQHLQTLRVPSTATPSLNSRDCSCVQIQHELEVLVTTSKAQRAIRAVLPLTIGTISMRSNLLTMPRDLSRSTPLLSAAKSMEDLDLIGSSMDDSITANGFNPTAPLADAESLAISMTSLHSSFREADFMATTNLNERRKKRSLAGDKQEFKPKYLFYELPNTELHPIPESSDSSIAPPSAPNISTSYEKTPL